jgi:hypothetical protein
VTANAIDMLQSFKMSLNLIAIVVSVEILMLVRHVKAIAIDC